jgi:hypothetical protein
VQTIRGGVVCIPIVAASGASTDLLVVDVPVIISALVDDADHNYWFLWWTPGANNQHVSVNVQTGSYPSAAGTVAGAGSVTKLYPISTQKVRIRFSGPSTTYYIKLWGERNGVYSATGAQATIVSDADVTPSDVWEPEPIGVIDIQLVAGYHVDDEEAPLPQTVEVYSGEFTYNGTDNIYIGGPSTQESFDILFNGTWGMGRLAADDYLIVTANGGTLTSMAGGRWQDPMLISSILVPGSNTITISIVNTQHHYIGCSTLRLRTYYT